MDIDVFRLCVLLSRDGVLSITEPLNFVRKINIPRSIILYSTLWLICLSVHTFFVAD